MTHSALSPEPVVRIDDGGIWSDLESASRSDAGEVRALLAKSRELKGLRGRDLAVLANVTDPALLDELFHTAREVKEAIYGRRIVLFAPLYISNLCANECTYCAFRARNTALVRRALTQEEISREVKWLEEQGHKRILLVAGESYPREGFDYVLRSIETVYATSSGPGEIRRVNVNVAPLTDGEFRRLKEAKIGTYQLFQETYHRETYAEVHVAGKKRDYDWRVTAMDRAMRAGIDDVGIGILFGLFDWRYELLALMQHVEHLERTFGVGPHTISVPRIEPATGSEVADHPPHAVSEVDFRKVIAILRLAVPYTGLILSTRESAETRREVLGLGISQISAGSRTNPGGYEADPGDACAEQFSLGDHRSLDEVIRDVASLGFVPSFCTACYRLGRTGADFMDVAKPGEIKEHCNPNALATFQEYLLDYGSAETRRAGESRIAATLEEMEPALREKSRKMVEAVKSGRRDVFC
ncbi:MAG TPA: [FeFe] hydrogenase H-cluster radical SAM maturase HydG [Thermoanaerobaculia bacterium]|nr:[FeFe] hydrogenase H-cluster radical SAM maturase HydG [Thermoanaerobaculia bacterium]HQP85392.1 [FeFe] hydrogenase H-cluster radical SAM maturase HydG [Thermoanaerobaculia bacterium]